MRSTKPIGITVPATSTYRNGTEIKTDLKYAFDAMWDMLSASEQEALMSNPIFQRLSEVLH